MKHRLILAALAAVPMLLTSISAQAADMRVPTYKAPVYAPPVFSWTGFYIGINGGAGWGTKEYSIPLIGPLFTNGSHTINGFLGGAQAGFNYQSGWVVFGAEVDGDLSDIKGGGSCFILALINCSAKLKHFETATVRLGGAVDRALLYVKGGVAWGQDEYNLNVLGIPALTSNLTSNRSGATIGTGVEYAFTSHWSGKVEYDYLAFGTKRENFPITALALTIPVDIRQNVHVVKAGLNYRFDWGGNCCDTVAARY